MPATHWVYTHIDSDGGALYVGCTNNPGTRFELHALTADWFPKIADVAVIGPFEKTHALSIEAEFIKALQPPNNIHHTSRDPRLRANRPLAVDDVPTYLRQIRGRSTYHWASRFGPKSYRSVCGMVAVPVGAEVDRAEPANCRVCIDSVARQVSRSAVA